MLIMKLTPKNLSEIDILNKENRNSQLYPIPLKDRTPVLLADLLSDCEEGQTWFNYRTFLKSLNIEDIPHERFAEADENGNYIFDK